MKNSASFKLWRETPFCVVIKEPHKDASSGGEYTLTYVRIGSQWYRTRHVQGDHTLFPKHTEDIPVDIRVEAEKASISLACPVCDEGIAPEDAVCICDYI